MSWKEYLGFESPKVMKASVIIVALLGVIVSGISWASSLQIAMPGAGVLSILGSYGFYPMVVVFCMYFIYSLCAKELRDPAIIRQLISDVFYILILCFALLLHINLKSWSLLINPELYDDFYWQGEQLTKPVTDGLLFIRSYLAQTDDFNNFYQMGYLTIFMFVFGFIMIADRRKYLRFYLALLIMVAIGAFSYYITPALGPFIYGDGHNLIANETFPILLENYHEMKAGGVEGYNANTAKYLGGTLAAVPSFHVATCFLAVWGLWISTTSILLRLASVGYLTFVILESIWTKWHYFIDAPAGIAVALMSIWIMQKILDREEKSNE